MSNKNKSKNSENKKSLLNSFLVKLPWIVAFSIFFMILSLKAMERFPVPLKEGFEGYFSEISGRTASITSLDKLMFFPELYIHMKDINFSNSDNAALVDMHIESAKIHIPFLSIFIGGRNIYDLEINNLHANEGIITPYQIDIEKLDIVDITNNSNEGRFNITGNYAGKDLVMNVDLIRKKTLLGNIVYKIPKNTSINLKIGDVSFNTNFINEGVDIWFRNGVLSYNNDNYTIKDSPFVKNREINKDNIMTCLFEHDYKHNDEICDEYINKKN